MGRSKLPRTRNRYRFRNFLYQPEPLCRCGLLFRFTRPPYDGRRNMGIMLGRNPPASRRQKIRKRCNGLDVQLRPAVMDGRTIPDRMLLPHLGIAERARRCTFDD